MTLLYDLVHSSMTWTCKYPSPPPQANYQVLISSRTANAPACHNMQASKAAQAAACICSQPVNVVASCRSISLWCGIIAMFPTISGAGAQPCLLLDTAPCRQPFAAARTSQTPHRRRCRAEGERTSGKQSAKSELADDVLRKLREAEAEAATLRQQLAEAKAKAEVSLCMPASSSAAIAYGALLVNNT